MMKVKNFRNYFTVPRTSSLLIMLTATKDKGHSRDNALNRDQKTIENMQIGVKYFFSQPIDLFLTGLFLITPYFYYSYIFLLLLPEQKKFTRLRKK